MGDFEQAFALLQEAAAAEIALPYDEVLDVVLDLYFHYFILEAAFRMGERWVGKNK